MKTSVKRAIAVFLVLVMLVSVMNIGAFAANAAISLGDVVNASATVNYGKLSLEFVPEETGSYAFYSMGESDTCGYIFDSNMNLLSENDDYYDLNFRVVCTMTAGTKYILRSELYSNNGEGEYSVAIEKVETAEEILIFHGGETTGYVGSYLYFECFGDTDEAYVGNCTWESDNENVAVIDYEYENSCDVFFTGTGKANITVTSDLGLSDTIEVTCIEPPVLKVDEPVYVTYGVEGGYRLYRFTPTQSGMYAVYTSGALMPALYICDSNMEPIGFTEAMGDEGEVKARCEMTAGETYYIEINAYLETPDHTICITPCVSAESITINAYGTTEAYTGMSTYLEALYSPELAATEDCTWSSSNTSVATIEDYGTGCEVYFVAPGTATITVISESGLTDSITVECLEVEEIKLNEQKTVGATEEGVFSFTPEVSGKYAFISEGDLDTSGIILDSEWWTIAGSDNNGIDLNFVACAEMTAGETYYLVCYNVGYDTEGSFSVTVTECATANSISFADSTIYAYVSERMEISVYFNPITAFPEECTFTTADPGVAEVGDEFGNSCIIDFAGEGTTTLTAVSESGLKATCTIVVSEISFTKLTLNTKADVTADKYANAYFEFTPEEDGTYSFLSMGELDTYASLLNEEMAEIAYDDDFGAGNNFCIQYDMLAGETYRFVTSHYEGQNIDNYSVIVVNTSYAESVSIDTDSTVYGEVDGSEVFFAEFLPQGALIEEMTWTVSDESVIEVYAAAGDMCAVKFVGEGIATLTVTTESGLTDSVNIVVGKDSIKLGDVNGDGQINAVDTNLLKRYVGGSDVEIYTINSDITEDGAVDSRDSNLLKRIVAGQ